MMLGAGRPNPRYSASLNALRSSARLAASRTRWSAHGDFGSHCWVKTSHWLTVGTTPFKARPPAGGAAGRRPPLLGVRPSEPVRDVAPAALDRPHARGLVRHRSEPQALHRRHLSPVALVGFGDQLDARVERHEAVRPRADRRL